MEYLLGAISFAVIIAAQVFAVFVVPELRFDDARAMSSPRTRDQPLDNRAKLAYQGGA